MPFGRPLFAVAPSFSLTARLSRPADSVAMGSSKCTDFRLEGTLFEGARRSGVTFGGVENKGGRLIYASLLSCAEAEASSGTVNQRRIGNYAHIILPDSWLSAVSTTSYMSRRGGRSFAAREAVDSFAIIFVVVVTSAVSERTSISQSAHRIE